ncbi:hypothetical protein O181_010581 [Austropuccinia psidii MF-1]|uniref:Uncharacterized protein n=1 Tax=Austropuccinia psidii MF-1 TaxID=1389203 RepID=A0A9Q3BRB3_9BASI|nr:hypothetical protein [Austropuccinia psidii MF-1]
MPIPHSTPARKTRSKTRTQAFLTPTPRDPLDGTTAVSQLRAHLDRGPNVEGETLTTLKCSGEDGEEEEGYPVEEEDSDGTEGATAPVGESQGTGGTTQA